MHAGSPTGLDSGLKEIMEIMDIIESPKQNMQLNRELYKEMDRNERLRISMIWIRKCFTQVFKMKPKHFFMMLKYH